MSHNGDADKLWRGQCPKCGNFCSKIIAYKSAKGDAISEWSKRDDGKTNDEFVCRGDVDVCGHCEKMMFRPYMSGLQSVEVTLEAERLDVLVNTPGAYMEIG